ncbi:cytochrome P450 6B7-like [Anticarsia gemmatalis]|uniref:cytochrome P450 6B7-like n=1 Tax=Anticarsia gemmatalis TaxID=129554 RepID=UPI003F75AABB
MFLPVILAGLVLSLIFVYIVGNNNERYWKKRGIKFYSKNKVMGPYFDFLTQSGPLFERFGDLYKQYKGEPALGIGSMMTPTLFVIDPKNVQHVLQTDFSSFYHRGVDASEDDRLANNIVFTNGPKWRLLRQSMTPLFTSAKLKNMYYIMDKSAQDFVIYIKEHPELWKGDCFNTMVTFCNAAVCGAIFGIGTESIFDSPFLDVAKAVSEPSWKFNFALAFMNMSPKLARFLGLGLFKDVEDFFIKAITNVIQQREKENVKKHDYADLCLNIQKNGIMKDATSGLEIKPTYEVLTAQALPFLSAGVEPVATAIFTAFMELGRNPDMLKKIHQEIDENFEKHNGKITYDVITNMEYVDKVLSEAMRINPPLGFLSRKCVKDTVLPVGNVKVESGTNIFTPIYAIHHDPEIYPEPHVFDPERFARNSNTIVEDHYMPFGMGNRMCIGARYSRLQMAAGLVHVLRHFTIKTKELNTRMKFKYHFFNVRPISADVEFFPRSSK